MSNRNLRFDVNKECFHVTGLRDGGHFVFLDGGRYRSNTSVYVNVGDSLIFQIPDMKAIYSVKCQAHTSEPTLTIFGMGYLDGFKIHFKDLRKIE